MDCHSYNELIHIYLDGDATKEQKEQLELTLLIAQAVRNTCMS